MKSTFLTHTNLFEAARRNLSSRLRQKNRSIASPSQFLACSHHFERIWSEVTNHDSLRRLCRRRQRRRQIRRHRCRVGRHRCSHPRPLFGLLCHRLGLELLDDGREGVGDDEDHDEEADQENDHCLEKRVTNFSIWLR